MLWLYMIIGFEGLLMMMLCHSILEGGEDDEN